MEGYVKADNLVKLEGRLWSLLLCDIWCSSKLKSGEAAFAESIDLR